jgi:hypothetical protein
MAEMRAKAVRLCGDGSKSMVGDIKFTDKQLGRDDWDENGERIDLYSILAKSLCRDGSKREIPAVGLTINGMKVNPMPEPYDWDENLIKAFEVLGKA